MLAWQMLKPEFTDSKQNCAAHYVSFLGADDDKLFDLQGSASFPDALSELGTLQEQPNDRQVGTAHIQRVL